MTVRNVKQIMILDDKIHQDYLKDFLEAPLNFEEFVNYMLGFLFDDDKFVEQIIPNNDATQIIIVYKIKI